MINIENGEITGNLPRRALNLVYDWLDLHKDELMENWRRMERGGELKSIKPLDWIMELLWMKKAEYLDGYKLSLVFNDGKRRIFDFSSLSDSDEKSYGPLKDMSVFKSFALDGWTVTWNEGRIDIAPEYLSSMESPHRRSSLRFLFVY